MFDKTNTADLQALSDEESLDPVGMGYAAVAGQTKKTLDLFNLVANNVVDTEDQYVSEVFTSEVALDVIDANEITVGAKFSEGQARWLDYLFSAAGSLGGKFAEFETQFKALFASYTPTSITLDNLAARNRKLGRIEFLFGANTVISRDDWAAVIAFRG